MSAGLLSSQSPLRRVLDAYRAGRLSQDDLLYAIDRLLIVDKIAPAALVDSLRLQQIADPLPPDVLDALRSRIHLSPQDPTVISRSRLQEAVGTASQPQPSQPRVGDTLQGRFELVELIGRGGMSRVFRAVDLRKVEARAEDPHVAVKVLTEPFSDYFGSVTVLQREAHKLQSLTHPNIVRVFDCDRDGQTVFMTMEYLAGDLLEKLLRATGGKPLVQATDWVRGLGEALSYAHDNQIVHGDLKPGNIIIHGGVPKVIDFGMAHFVARTDSPWSAGTPALADDAPRAVTPRYASPQLLAGAPPEVTDDVYALACIAYELLSGKRIPEGAARPVRAPGISRVQYAAILRALSVDQEDRTKTVAAFLLEFESGGRRRRIVTRIVAGCALLMLATLWLAYVFLQSHTLQAGVPRGPIPAAGGRIRDCPTCPLMTVLPRGGFDMGADQGDPELLALESPKHAVTINYSLAMGTNEVTVAEFREFAETTRYRMSGCNIYDAKWVYRAGADWQSPGFVQSGAHPVVCTSWNDATAYARWLSVKTGHHYRLPSAAEWEYAARAGSRTAPWKESEALACEFANVADQSAEQRYPGLKSFACSDGYVGTAPVATFKSNAFGLNDLLGNAFEWVQDCWYGDYVGAPSDGSARLTAGCNEHELRGGSWLSAPKFVDAAYRNRFDAEYRSSSVGFRLVRDVRE